jgi:hypothetical protein
LAETEVLPFPAPNVRVLAVAPDPFVMDVVFVELKPCSKATEFAKRLNPEITVSVGLTVPLVTAPAKIKL